MCKEKKPEEGLTLSKLVDGAFGIVYVYRQKLIDDEEYEEVIALDKLIAYVKAHLES
tara:strand:- start:379 stop:549 length:171 start_codon:yes stop_codon:yes gene_type:complete